MKYRYTVDEVLDEKHQDWAFDIDVNWTDDLENVAEEMAEQYHSNHDGWEGFWPREFYIYDEEFKYLGCVKVEREYKPDFYGTILIEIGIEE